MAEAVTANWEQHVAATALGIGSVENRWRRVEV
jgi:hypothetical protein